MAGAGENVVEIRICGPQSLRIIKSVTILRHDPPQGSGIFLGMVQGGKAGTAKVIDPAVLRQIAGADSAKADSRRKEELMSSAVKLCTTAPPLHPASMRIRPFCCSIRSASRMLGRLRWNCSASTRSAGSRSPGRSSPEAIF